MQFFIDSADVKEIEALKAFGFVDGVTTNPSIIAKSGLNMRTVIKDICSIVEGPVSAEVVGVEVGDMLREADVLAAIAKNVVIKAPLTPAGLTVTHQLYARGIPTNVTLCFSAAQAILAAKAGATFVSPFIGRLDDIGKDGIGLIRDIRDIYQNYDIQTKILAASIRGVHHVVQAALAGADVVTATPQVYRQMFNHPLTDLGLEAFLKDWAKTGQTI